jgi:16S rRNA (cytidine1402-2'-O)-methyltransferase
MPVSLFYGFLPSKAGQRAEALRELARLPYALIFYEAPHRILETVAALADAFEPARTLVLARELTKLFEQIHCCALSEAHAWLSADANRQRGEFVLLVSGAPPVEDKAPKANGCCSCCSTDGLSVSQASRLAHAITGVNRKTLYQRALDLQGRAQPVDGQRLSLVDE